MRDETNKGLVIWAQMPMSKVATNAVRVATFLLLVASILVATLVFHVQDHIGDILDWIEEHRVAGSVSFVALYALFTGAKDETHAPCSILKARRGFSEQLLECFGILVLFWSAPCLDSSKIFPVLV